MGESETTYRGVPGAFVYSYRQSASRAYRLYAVVSALVMLLVGLLFTFGLIGVVAGTLGASELVTLVRSFFVLLAAVVAAPILAPVLLVARRHRREGSTVEYDAALAVCGFVFVLALYLGLAMSVPPELQNAPSGLLAPIEAAVYAAPRFAGAVPPLVATLLIVLAHRRYR